MRFAIVMYGGVSLAVYIYGVALELFELVRATASDGEGSFVFPDVSGTAAVYRRVAREYGSPTLRDASEGLGCKFIVDIISGTSAGGLNGVCLAAALAGDRAGTADNPLGALERLWINEGDIGRLIADEQSTWRYDDSGEPVLENGMPRVDPDMKFAPGVSLLNGRRFYRLLTDTMQGMLNEARGDGQSRLVDELDLWVTATDLDGRRIELPLKNETVSETDHHIRFHFHYEANQHSNDFRDGLGPFIGFAGRATSSFPGAFAPVTLDEFEPENESRRRFYPAYDGGQRVYGRRVLSDGGILDNKPFTGATASLLERRANLPVNRKLLYVEPDPGEPAEARESWNGLQTAQAALIGIPRNETIYADISALLLRNRTITRAREIVALAGTDAIHVGPLMAFVFEPIDEATWTTTPVEMLAGEYTFLGPTYTTYHRLRVRDVTDFLASTLASAAGFSADGAEWEALTYVIRAWRAAHYSEEPSSPLSRENEFLRDFDLPYRTRRLTFVLDRLKALELGDESAIAQAATTAGLEAPPPPGPDELAAREQLTEIRIRLTAALEVLVAAHRGPNFGLGAWLDAPGDRDRLVSILSGADDATRFNAARTYLESNDRIDAVLEGFQEVCPAAAARGRDRVALALGDPLWRDGGVLLDSTAWSFRAWSRWLLRFHYDAYPLFDLVSLPLSFGTEAAHTNPVDIYRISPDSSTGPPGVKPELLGASAGHFGAFFDASWRRHDIAWGRMNAAEQLVRATLGSDDPRTDALISAAHEEIIKQYVDCAGDAAEDATRLGGIAVPDAPPTATLDDTVSRMGVAAGDVAVGLSGSSVAQRMVQAVGAGLLTPGGPLKAATAALAAAVPKTARWLGGLALAGLIVLASAATALALASGSWLAWLLALVLTAVSAAFASVVAIALAGVGIAAVRARGFIRDKIGALVRAPRA